MIRSFTLLLLAAVLAAGPARGLYARQVSSSVLSYDIVTQGHGGTLRVESTEGEGATFVITLPCDSPNTG